MHFGASPPWGQLFIDQFPPGSDTWQSRMDWVESPSVVDGYKQTGNFINPEDLPFPEPWCRDSEARFQ